ncbi:hypothetical protein SDC9_133112 [bioreactor metagenome]|uniref:Uncharacterized protein n=1 Tax=bioreactor metagenome TaxID=1076179 RepID=A0A645DA15_9ZZZZ
MADLIKGLADGHGRIERRKRVLENHLHLLAVGLQLPALQVADLRSLKVDLPSADG